MNDIGQILGIIDLRESNVGFTKEFLESLGYKEIENPTLSIKVDNEELLSKIYSRKNIDR